MSAIPDSLREFIRKRAQGRCEYCLIPEEVFLFPHEPDHIIATQHGGISVPENLAYACSACNRRKGPNIASLDPTSNTIAPLFNPRKARWGEHFALDGPRIVGLTPEGRATVILLQLNSDDRLIRRRWLQSMGDYPAGV